MPPIRSGSTVRVGLDAAAGGAARSGRRSRAPRRRRARYAVVSSTFELALLARRRAARTRARPRSTSPARPFSTRSSRKFGRAGQRSPSEPRRARRPSRAGRAAGCAGLGAARAPAPIASTKSPSSLPDRRDAAGLLRGLVERARVGAVDDAHWLRLRLQHGEVELADRVLDQPAVVVAVEHLAGHLRVAISVRSATSERICSSARCVSASIWRLRLLEAALAVGLGLLADALALRRRRPCGASARISSASPLRLADQRAVLLEQPARLLAGAVGLVDRLGGSARAARRSPSGSGRTRTA